MNKANKRRVNVQKTTVHLRKIHQYLKVSVKQKNFKIPNGILSYNYS